MRLFRRFRYKFSRLNNRFFHRYDLIRTGLDKWEWHDVVETMFYANMNMLVDFVEKEKCFEMVDWSHDDHSDEIHRVGLEIKAIYDWWKDFPRREKEVDDKLHEWATNAKFKFAKRTSVQHGKETYYQLEDLPVSEEQLLKERSLSNELTNLENTLEKEKQEMLERLIKIRVYLWT